MHTVHWLAENKSKKSQTLRLLFMHSAWTVTTSLTNTWKKKKKKKKNRKTQTHTQTWFPNVALIFASLFYLNIFFSLPPFPPNRISIIPNPPKLDATPSQSNCPHFSIVATSWWSHGWDVIPSSLFVNKDGTATFLAVEQIELRFGAWICNAAPWPPHIMTHIEDWI